MDFEFAQMIDGNIVAASRIDASLNKLAIDIDFGMQIYISALLT